MNSNYGPVMNPCLVFFTIAFSAKSYLQKQINVMGA